MPEDVVETQGVTQPDPPTSSSDSPQGTPSPGVKDGSDLETGDRPLKNYIAEYDRKLGALEQRIDQRFTQLASLLQPAHTSQPREYTDQELAELALQGNSQALDLLTERKAARQRTALEGDMAKRQRVERRMADLTSRYRGFSDASSPLYLSTAREFQSLIAEGYSNTPETILQAMSLAVATTPTQSVSSEPSRQSVLQPQLTVEGTAPRRKTTPVPVEPQPSKEELALAARMGVKDPAGAKKRLEERLRNKRASLSPLLDVVLYPREEE